MTGLHNRSHPLRDMLDKELQQRTFPALTAPCRLCQFMLTVSPASRSSELTFIQQLARSQGSHFSDADNDINLPLFGGSLRFEKHGEFSSYVFIQHGSAKQLFDDPLDFLPTKDWLDDIPGQIFRVVQLSVITPAQLNTCGNIDTLFNPDNCISSMLAGGKACIWTDFQKHAEGAGHQHADAEAGVSHGPTRSACRHHRSPWPRSQGLQHPQRREGAEPATGRLALQRWGRDHRCLQQGNTFMSNRWTLLACLWLAAANAFAQEALPYQTPPAEILQLADVQRPPSVVTDSRKQYLVLFYRDTFKSLAELSDAVKARRAR